jgi:hypothetical protein
MAQKVNFLLSTGSYMYEKAKTHFDYSIKNLLTLYASKQWIESLVEKPT